MRIRLSDAGWLMLVYIKCMGRRKSIAVMLAVLLLVAVFFAFSCGQAGNATGAEREQLLRAVRFYWETGKDYSTGFTSGVGDLRYADVQGDEAEVRVDIVIGYTQPTDGAGYKETTFRLRRAVDSWYVTYDGWADEEVENRPRL